MPRASASSAGTHANHPRLRVSAIPRILAAVGPLASVVVPVYNGMPHLAELVPALLAQDYPDLEIVFSDGGSTDGSLASCRAFTIPACAS